MQGKVPGSRSSMCEGLRSKESPSRFEEGKGKQKTACLELSEEGLS